MAILLKPNNTSYIVVPKNKRNGFTLDELYKLIECETVQMIYLDDKRTMWMDEESKLKAVPPPVNILATQYLHRAGGALDDFILGNVLICEKSEVK
jgi:hypothetical protein